MLLLRSYSHFSLLSAIPKVSALIIRAKELGYTTIALTDEDTTAGLVDFWDNCVKHGIKPILGTTLNIKNLSSSYGRTSGFSKIALLARDYIGYQQILRLVTLARTVNDQPKYHINLSDLTPAKQAGFGCNFTTVITADHELSQLLMAGDSKQSESLIQTYIKTLTKENLVIELLVPFFDQDAEAVKKANILLASICDKLEVKYLASPAARYLEQGDDEPFRAVLAIKKQVRIDSIKLERSFHLPGAQELAQMYDYLPKATDWQTLDKTFNCTLRTDYADKAGEAYFPPVDLLDGQTYDDLLKWETYIGLLVRFHPIQQSRQKWKLVYPYASIDKLVIDCQNMPIDPAVLKSYPLSYWTEPNRIAEYITQVETELKIIRDKGYSSYFLVVGDLAQYCKDSNIMASARGSGAGSLIGYLNNISTADTVFYQIPFERFLNPLRPSAPDVDLDVADDKREQVIQYLVTKYGANRVSQIGTYGTMAPRAAIRDIGRVLGVNYRKCDQLSKLIPMPPFGKKPTFKYTFENSAEFNQVYENDDDVARIVNIAKLIEGNYRHSSVHAAGVMVTPTPTTDHTALQWDRERKMVVTQYEGNDCERVGIMPCKMDILGIANFSILANSIDMVKRNKGVEIDLFNIAYDDPKVYKLLSEGKTMGIFQLSGGGITKYLIQLKPTKIEDVMAMVALYRPGAMMSIPEFIRRKNNASLVKYYVPEMEDWMTGTYGILVYQEDIMFLFMKLAGYNFGQADNVRRAMGKKKKEVLEKEFGNFTDGCLAHGLQESKIKELWDLIVPFTDYSFNKAHSSAYGIVAYWTAYMKANYPAEFMTALMTSDEGDMVKTRDAINECIAMDIEIMPPDINQSNQTYTIIDDTRIVYGLGSVKNLGSDIIGHIVTDRERGGKFENLDDFLERMSAIGNFNKRSLEALVVSGAMDGLRA
ncbi:MAG: DNA polymerase III subunit alpha [Candidatus Parcubacteria bacterium]|nr:DNA polymerase III subunit alpha [Candidatus Paceibacterota bacterium]